MIFADTKRNTVTIRGKSPDVFNELLNAIMKIAEDGGKKVKEDLRKILISDKFWDSIECDEDEEE